jgi:hypothetical protein
VSGESGIQQATNPTSPSQPTQPLPPRSGVVWYNHLKLKDIKQRVATQQRGDSSSGSAGAGPTKGAAGAGGPHGLSGDEEDGRPPLVDIVVTHRSKREILSEIKRLQEEMDLLEQRQGGDGSSGGGGGGGSRQLIGTRVATSGDGAVGASSVLSGVWGMGGAAVGLGADLKSRVGAAVSPGPLARAAAAGAASPRGLNPVAEKEV